MARVLITGCSSGIGRAASVELTKRGHDVVATARRPETLDDLDVAQKLRLDVTDDDSVAEAVAAAVAAAGPLDALVNNAGIDMHGPIEWGPIDDVRRLFETNFFGPMRMVQAVVPGMRERGRGVVVNVSSVAGRVAAPLTGYYSATKWALEAFSESLHVEIGHFGVRVVIVEPGFVETNIALNDISYGMDRPPYDELARQWAQVEATLVAGGRPGPEACAAAIADAVERDDTPLRVPVGADAEMVLATRASLDDAAFEATMRAAVGLTW